MRLSLVVASMAVAFAAGWLVARIGDVGKQSLGEITANRWIDHLGMLVDNVRHLAPVDRETTQSVIRQGLESDSATLAQLYDGMSPHLKERLVFYIPLARAIAAAQPATAFGLHDRHALLIFADCMQKVQSQGGSVRECFERRRTEK